VNNGYYSNNAAGTDGINARNGLLKNGTRFRISKPSGKSLINRSIHSTEISKEYPTGEDLRKSRGVENLSFQEWTEKYNQ